VRETGRAGGVPASKIEGLRFAEIRIVGDTDARKPVLMDFAYLAEQRRVILSALLAGAAFLVALFVVTLLLGSMI
jgi:hypothetical protein